MDGSLSDDKKPRGNRANLTQTNQQAHYTVIAYAGQKIQGSKRATPLSFLTCKGLVGNGTLLLLPLGLPVHPDH